MDADRKVLGDILAKLRECHEQLSRSRAPAGIADHIQMAIRRLKDHIQMIDKWDQHPPD